MMAKIKVMGKTITQVPKNFKEAENVTCQLVEYDGKEWGAEWW